MTRGSRMAIVLDEISGYQDFEDAAAMLTVAVNSEASPDARRELLGACWWLRDAIAKIEGSVR